MSIMFVVRNRLVESYSPKGEKIKQFVQVKKTGTRYQTHGGGVVELFRVKVFADAIDRTVIVVKQWEAKGLIPKPLYQIDGDQCRHWYSAAQVINCHRLMHGRYRGQKYLPSAELAHLFENMKKVWSARDIVVGEDGSFQETTT